MKKSIGSVVIANHNGATHLRNCLPSLLNQSYESFEIIVVDNTSRSPEAALLCFGAL